MNQSTRALDLSLELMSREMSDFFSPTREEGH